MAEKEIKIEELEARIEEINDDLVANYEEMSEMLKLVNEPTSLILWSDIRLTAQNSYDLLIERQYIEGQIRMAKYEAKNGK